MPAKSAAQQKAAGAALSAKRGKTKSIPVKSLAQIPVDRSPATAAKKPVRHPAASAKKPASAKAR